MRSLRDVERFERLRQRMTEAQVREFAEAVDVRARAAYEAGAKWFMKIVKAPGNRGRDQLYVFVRHWLTSYLQNPRRFVEMR